MAHLAPPSPTERMLTGIMPSGTVEIAEGLDVKPVTPRLTEQMLWPQTDPEDYYQTALTIPLLGRFTNIYVLDINLLLKKS